MSTAAPPPPPPPPSHPSHGHQRESITPSPGYAAIPYSSDSPPVQETSPSPEAIHSAEGAPASSPLPVQNGPQSPPPEGQKDNPSDSEVRHHPVQETDPVPQTEQQDDVPNQMDQTGEDQMT
ncbi:protein shisa-5-like [Sander lucioperca]|uniref:protein shisa-5-like n=1 Tax=Sander lucioperca TaxID=283035 RepID=UPI00125E80D5|nr:protein shisa-5-like [Sander lucioperca]